MHRDAHERIHQIVADTEYPGRQVIFHPVISPCNRVHRPLRGPFAYLEVEMRAERIARIARQADDFAPLYGETTRLGKKVDVVALLPVTLTAHVRLHLRNKFTEMAVDRDITVRMRHIDHIAVTVSFTPIR